MRLKSMIVLVGMVWMLGISNPLLHAANHSIPIASSSPQIPNSWSDEFATGLEQLGMVRDIITTSNGDLYVLGDFDQVAGVDAKSIARWDGTAWSMVVPTVPPGQLTDMAIYRDTLYVVTASAYRSTSGGLWQYTATTQQWHKIGIPSYYNSEQAPGSISQLTVFNDRLIISGDFEQMNDMPLSGIVAWDGTTFTGFAPQPPYFYVHELDVISPTAMLVYAHVMDAQTGEYTPYLGRGDGITWEALPLPMGTEPTALVVEGTTVYAFTSLMMFRLNDNHWDSLGTYTGRVIGMLDGQLYTQVCGNTCANFILQRGTGPSTVSLATYEANGRYETTGVATIINGTIYLGGQYRLADGSKHALLVYADDHLAGFGDRLIKIGRPRDIEFTQGTVYVTSNLDYTGALTASNVMTWHAGEWQRFWDTDAIRQTTNLVNDLTVIQPDEVWLAGSTLSVSLTQTTGLLRKTPTQRENLDPNAQCDTIKYASFQAPHLYVACKSTTLYGMVKQFDGQTWTTIAPLTPSDDVAWINDGRQINAVGTTFYAILQEYGPSYQPEDNYYLHKWNGSRWGFVRFEGDLIRSFVQTTDSTYFGTRKVYRGTPTAAQLIGSTNGEVHAIAVDGSRVWIGGSFSMVDGVAANNIALWDDTGWHALGAGTNGRVETLRYSDGQLLVNGRFTKAGGIPANGISIWSADPPAYRIYGSFVVR